MFGLAVGGLLATEAVARRPHLGLRALLMVNSVLVLFAASIPTLLQVLSLAGYYGQEAGYGVLVWTSGLLTGAVFPLAAHLVRSTGAAVAGTAGRLDWADHTGACVGALVTGVVLVPVTGLTGACYVVSALAATSLLLLLVSAWRYKSFVHS